MSVSSSAQTLRAPSVAAARQDLPSMVMEKAVMVMHLMNRS